MSTYLVAFVIGAYDYVETHDANGVLIRVYTPVGKKEQGLFALKVSKKTFEIFSEIDIDICVRLLPIFYHSLHNISASNIH